MDFSKINKNHLLTGIAVLGIVITAALTLTDGNPLNAINFKGGLPAEEIAKISIDYLNNKVLNGQSTAEMVNYAEENGLVKIRIKIGNNEFDSYATKDGKLLFPQAFKITGDEAKTAAAQNNNQNAKPADIAKSCEDVKKTDKPLLEAYVVSQCPFGLQMQRVLADVIKGAPALAENIEVKYMGSVVNGKITAMHGDKEAQENLKQICIREEQNSKYWPYVSCYMEKGDTDGCLKSTGVNLAKLNSCATDADKGLAYAQKDFDLTDKYGVQGSPTLIMGGEQVSEFGFGGRTSEAVKSLLCCGFDSKPGVCDTKLNTASAATSFSLTYGSSGGSGSNAANCAPAQ